MIRRVALPLLVLLLGYPPPLSADSQTVRTARLAVPVADLRRDPLPASKSMEYDPLEESQLLYGDPVEIFEEKDGWVRVSAVEQLEWSHNHQWEGYPGWIKLEELAQGPANWVPNLRVTAKLGSVRDRPSGKAAVRLALSLGSRLMGTTQVVPAEEGLGAWWQVQLLDGSLGWIPSQEVTPFSQEGLAVIHLPAHGDPADLRKRLVETARLFRGDPYYWGGRSSHHPNQKGPPHTGVDCSGLVGLVYQANGMQIPRDAHEQWMRAKPIDRKELLPGDLVFVYEMEQSERVGHVMIYLGEDRVIEGPGTGEVVHELELKKRLKEAGGRQVSFGTFLWDS